MSRWVAKGPGGVRSPARPRTISRRESRRYVGVMNSRQSTSVPHDAIEQLEQLERAQRQWTLIDVLLRRLATRLTYAADGRTAELDETLGELRQQLREPIDERGLESLLTSLTDAVRSLDTLSAAATPAPAPAPAPIADCAWTASAAAVLLSLLDHLNPDTFPEDRLAHKRRAINEARDEASLGTQAEAVARLVNRQLGQLGEQRAAAERLLDHVTRQLDELARYLEQEGVDRLEGSDTRQALDQHLASEIDALGGHLQDSGDTSPLHREVQTRLGTITSHLKTFREREEAREREWRARSDKMTQRIHELEHSAQAMEASLQQEHQLASTDPLTGLANRLVFEQRMQQLCDDSPGSGEMCLLVLDIDHFKQINDRFGHAAGDRALRIVADQLANRMRPDDLLARYGGEEFVVILPATDSDGGYRIAEQLRTCIESIAFRGEQQPVRITLSCGIASLRAGDSPDQLFDRADRALYRAKRDGRNRCERA